MEITHPSLIKVVTCKHSENDWHAHATSTWLLYTLANGVGHYCIRSLLDDQCMQMSVPPLCMQYGQACQPTC